MEKKVKKGTISVIVLSKNNGDTIERTLRSILNAETPYGYQKEVIVVDAHSSDNTPQILQKFKNKIKVVYDEGKGIGIARNIGILSSKGEYICFVDADCIVAKEHFIKIIKTFEKGADIVDAGGYIPINIVSKLKIPKFSRLELAIWNIGKAYASKKLLRDRCFAGGAFMSFKREVFYAVNGFWSFPPYGCDDLDFSYRARRRGFKIMVTRIKKTISLPRLTLRDFIKEQIGWGTGYAYFIGKYRNDINLWKCYRYPSIIYKILGRYAWLYVIFTLILAPLRAITLIFKLRDVHAFPYWIVRRYAFLYGLLKNLKQGMNYFSISSAS